MGGGASSMVSRVWETRSGTLAWWRWRGMLRRAQRASTKCWSASASEPRRPWLTWTALRPTPRESRDVELAAWRARRRATESAPPETAAQRRSPGLISLRLKVRGGWDGMRLHLKCWFGRFDVTAG